MKTLVMAAAAASALVATPVLAGTLQGEVRLSDVRGGQRPDSTEYRVQWDAPIAYGFTYGVELQTKQKEDAGSLSSKVSGKLGYEVPTVLGFKTVAYGEVGKNLEQNRNFEFWGAGIKTKRQVYGPFSVNAGYRHREGFNGVDGLNEERVHGGIGYALSDKDTVGVTYYRTSGTTRQDAIGLGLTHSF